MKKTFRYIAAAALAALAACGGKGEWTVTGQIDGAEGQTMILEASTNGRWYPLDSVTLPSTGKFKISHAAIGYPDIYRLRLADKTLYFPIDSIETVSVMAKADGFDRDYTLSGTPTAEMLMNVDRRVMTAAAQHGAASLANDTTLKRELGRMMLGDPAGIVSYYLLNKRVGGMPLYNPGNKADNRIIGAIANAYNEMRPNDPRTAFLRSLFLANRPRTSASPLDTIAAEEASLLEIKLYDNTGKEQSLRQAAADNRVVLLNFTVYEAEASPAYNAELNRLYTDYNPKGLEIYQISFDDNEYRWRSSAKNLPWVTVYNSSADGLDNLLRYNVGSLPALFVIVDGEIRERVTDASKIEQTLRKYL